MNYVNSHHIKIIMRKIYTLSLILLTAFLFTQCTSKDAPIKDEKGKLREFPETIEKMFAAHGGLERWKKMSTLEFDIYNSSDSSKMETHVLDLKTRSALITGEGYKVGFDGNEAWVDNPAVFGDNQSPLFYHNLFFYFHSLPFLAGDPGIRFEEKKDKELVGKKYKVVSIKYEQGVGYSSEDEYLLYIDPSTYLLKYVLYTVTYFSNESSQTYSALKYTAWENIDNFYLPKGLEGYKYEMRDLGEERYKKTIINKSITSESRDSKIYSAPTGSKTEKPKS